MAYLGRGIENLSDRVVLDDITTSATATYNLTLNSVAFVPSSSESLTCSLNGVVQKSGGTNPSFTVSGSQIIFSSALTSSDSIDFIIAERGITLQTPSAGSVNTDQLAASAVTNAKIASDAAIATTKLGTGAVLQVVNGTTSTGVSSTSNTFADTGLSASITPSSTSNKILVIINQNGLRKENDAANNDIGIKVFRGTTEIAEPTRFSLFTGTATRLYGTTVSGCYLDTPSSTSSLTYKTQFRRPDGAGTVHVQSVGTSTITLLEIAG